MNQRKFTLKELTQAVGRLRSIHTLPYHCEVCERKRMAEVVVVTSNFVPVGVCLLCATSLIAHSVKRRNDDDTPLHGAVIGSTVRAQTGGRITRKKGTK